MMFPVEECCYPIKKGGGADTNAVNPHIFYRWSPPGNKRLMKFISCSETDTENERSENQCPSPESTDEKWEKDKKRQDKILCHMGKFPYRMFQISGIRFDFRFRELQMKYLIADIDCHVADLAAETSGCFTGLGRK